MRAYVQKVVQPADLAYPDLLGFLLGCCGLRFVLRVARFISTRFDQAEIGMVASGHPVAGGAMTTGLFLPLGLLAQYPRSKSQGEIRLATTLWPGK